MNIQEQDILNEIISDKFINQRQLAETSGHSLGVVNRSLKRLIQEGYLDASMSPTEKARQEFREKKPQRAIILAAGFGMRMVPINMEIPKGLLEIKGEKLIERLILQLQEANVREIYIVVGFMKEKYEYLIDKYEVKLVVNPDYFRMNNLHSIKLVQKYLRNTYIVPCDIWCKNNPFHAYEPYSWYMVSDQMDDESDVRVNRKRELVMVSEEEQGNTMIGISYLTGEEADAVREKIGVLCRDSHYNDAFWEQTLYRGDHMIVAARIVPQADVIEINTYEQLREFESDSDQLKNDAIDEICKVLKSEEREINNIKVLKKGMTNRSFLFSCREKKYIMRIPGEGTEQLIDRQKEYSVYKEIRGKNICDNIIYLNPLNGYKITEYMEGARVCDPCKEDDLQKCMRRLRQFHELKLKVEHKFDLFEQIAFYESLWDGRPSVYEDYQRTKENVYSLKTYIRENAAPKVLTHIDAVPDNFLFCEKNGEEQIYLIDWEYAGMQDPHVDIAMFCIYALYDREQIDHMIDLYFTEGCTAETRIKIYCYIAVCGLLWSNWCEYKYSLGVEFGEYSLQQYRYAKDYYKIALAEMQKRGWTIINE